MRESKTNEVFLMDFVSSHRCLECPVTDHTYDDCRLMQLASKLEMPMETGIVEFMKLHSKLG